MVFGIELVIMEEHSKLFYVQFVKKYLEWKNIFLNKRKGHFKIFKNENKIVKDKNDYLLLNESS